MNIDYSKCTDEQLRVAIAKWMGIAFCPSCLNELPDPDVCHCGDIRKNHPVDHGFVPMGCVCGYADQSKVIKGTIPNYPNSLDAVALVEAKLNRNQYLDYAEWIREIVYAADNNQTDAEFDFSCFTATARQRCEALAAVLQLPEVKL